MKSTCLDAQVVSAHIHTSDDGILKIPEKELIEVAEAILYESSSDDCRFEILYESDAFQYKGTCIIENRYGSYCRYRKSIISILDIVPCEDDLVVSRNEIKRCEKYIESYVDYHMMIMD